MEVVVIDYNISLFKKKDETYTTVYRWRKLMDDWQIENGGSSK